MSNNLFTCRGFSLTEGGARCERLYGRESGRSLSDRPSSKASVVALRCDTTQWGLCARWAFLDGIILFVYFCLRLKTKLKGCLEPHQVLELSPFCKSEAHSGRLCLFRRRGVRFPGKWQTSNIWRLCWQRVFRRWFFKTSSALFKAWGCP